MRWLGELGRRVTMLAQRRRWRRELDEEMRLHLELRADPRRFGNELRIRERSQDMWGWRWLEALGQDARHGLRLLARTPVATALALLSLTLGIGANTALFSLTDAVLLRPLPVAHPEELVQLFTRIRVVEQAWPAFSNPLWEQIRNHQDAFQGVFAWSHTAFDLGASGELHAAGIYASGDYFSTLGVHPKRGRLFARADDFPGCPAVADISDGFWRSHFDGAASALGAAIQLSGHSFTVIGVTPAAFFGTDVGERFDVAVPLCAEAIVGMQAQSLLPERNTWWLSVMGRLRPGESMAVATARLAALKPQLATALPDDYTAADRRGFQLSLQSAALGPADQVGLRTSYGLPLKALLGVAGLVLLVACANLAGLMLARATARRQEIAVRLALGGSRGRLIRQLLTETLLLAVGGAALGAGFAAWACAAVERFLSYPNSLVSLNLTPDARVLAFTVGLTLATALLVGLIPALRATRMPLAAAPRPLAAPARTSGRWIAAAQLALSLVLLAGAGLFLRSFAQLVGPGKGFDPRGVLLVSARIAPRAGSLPTGELERLLTLPGVEAASASLLVPTQGSTWSGPLQMFEENGVAKMVPVAFYNAVAPGYFAALRTPLLRGRDFGSGDTPATPAVAIVNTTLARELASRGNVLGGHIRLVNGSGPICQIVGVVADAKYRRLQDAPPPTAYFALAQQPEPHHIVTYYLRSAIPMTALAVEARVALTRDAPTARLQVQTFNALVTDSVKPQRLLATLSEVFGGLALLIAAIGLYGILAYSASRRRREFGIRAALGARPGAIAGLVLQELAGVLAVGAAVGLALAWLGAHVAQAALGKLLFGLKPDDPVTLAGAAVLLIAVALTAGYFPARRAARADPMLALREE